MANWFEDNPTKSVIAHTVLVMGVTWAVSTFVLQDNRLNLAKSELEAQKSLTEQYKAKVELLQRDVDAVRVENTEYRAWLGQTKDAIPAVLPRINELKEKVIQLEADVVRYRSEAPNPLIETKSIQVSIGQAYLDEVTGLIVAVSRTTANREAYVKIKKPGKESADESLVGPGAQWTFEYSGKVGTLTVTEISFLSDTVSFRLLVKP